MVLTIDQIQRIAAPIAASYGILSLSLLGSYARGEATEDSDVDLLIERGDALRGWEIDGLYVDLCDALEKELDLVTVECMDPDFLSRIRQDAVKLYEQP